MIDESFYPAPACLGACGSLVHKLHKTHTCIHPSIRYIAARIDDRLQCKLRNEYLGTSSSLVGPMQPANNSEVFNPLSAVRRSSSSISVLTLSVASHANIQMHTTGHS